MRIKSSLLALLGGLTMVGLLACGGSEPHSASYPRQAKGSYEPASPAYGAPEAEASYADEGAAPSAPPPAAGRARYQSAQPSPGDAEARAVPSPDAPALREPPPESRPGLGTEWGENRHSRVTTAPFVRADRTSPFGLASIFYNDAAGIAAMSDRLGSSRVSTQRFVVGQGYLEVGLRSENGSFLTGFTANGRSYVEGVAGQRYSIFIRNLTPGRIEAVVTVDGLDVIDGRAGSLAKRGYLIDPHGVLEVDGFRRSTTEVAAFRFGSVQSSYASRKHGDSRNVGVIGVAFFHERGDSPSNWVTSPSHDEVLRRQSADPFPQQYATPPN